MIRNRDLYLFWDYAQKDINRLVKAVQAIKENTTDGRALFESYRANWDQFDDFNRAVRFFVLNRITFSGVIDSGGYSDQSFHNRFTESSIDRLLALNSVLSDVKITNLDYQEVIQTAGKNVFIFLDPPYYSNSNSRLYGKNGDLHDGFDHQRLASVIKNCPHKWLITYDDCEAIRELYQFANIVPWTLQYGMNNYRQKNAEAGNELFISNYPITHLVKSNSAGVQIPLWADEWIK